MYNEAHEIRSESYRINFVAIIRSNNLTECSSSLKPGTRISIKNWLFLEPPFKY